MKFWLENLKGRDHLGDKHRLEDYIKMDLNCFPDYPKIFGLMIFGKKY
jgi:hypothetical protein